MKPEQDKLESYAVKVLEDGKHFAQELLQENEQLRQQIAVLRNEKRELESHYIRVDVPRLQERLRLLEDENKSLRGEVQELNDLFTSIEKEDWEFSERCIEVEQQNSTLINMYVSNFRLHATLDFNEVLQTMKEIIVNLIGSEWFEIYLLDPKESRLVLVESQGWEVKPESSSPLDRYAVLAEVLKSGACWVAEKDKVMDKTGDDPVACIPLKVCGKVVGVVIIRTVLIQKNGFQALDRNLFELLSEQSATALLGAMLHTYLDADIVLPQVFEKVRERNAHRA